MSVGEIAARLDDRSDLLPGGRRTQLAGDGVRELGQPALQGVELLHAIQDVSCSAIAA
jgi:hypothetical protein